MALPLQTAWQLRTIEGEPSAIVRAKNIQAIIQGPSDAWGRRGRPQPALISAEVSLAQPFGSSSSGDVVASDTVHYGLLSKAVLSTLGRVDAWAAQGEHVSLHGLVNAIWTDLTGFDVSGARGDGGDRKPFLALSFVRRLTISVVLTKASLLGSGVSLTASAVFEDSTPLARSLSLELQELRVPTLIGVNDNERLANQIVVATIRVDKYETHEDGHAPLEAVVVDTMGKSSFETLEALTTHLASHITKHLVSSGVVPPDSQGWKLDIGLDKPTAVPLADAAHVELRTSTASFI